MERKQAIPATAPLVNLSLTLTFHGIFFDEARSPYPHIPQA
ncbi:MAG: hypothetical protein AB4426_27385 [Xenococcaceae cyanobacterium]